MTLRKLHIWGNIIINVCSTFRNNLSNGFGVITCASFKSKVIKSQKFQISEYRQNGTYVEGSTAEPMTLIFHHELENVLPLSHYDCQSACQLCEQSLQCFEFPAYTGRQSKDRLGWVGCDYTQYAVLFYLLLFRHQVILHITIVFTSH